MQIEFGTKVKGGLPVVAVATFYNGDLDEVTLYTVRGHKMRRAAWLERNLSKADEEALNDAAYEARAEAN